MHISRPVSRGRYSDSHTHRHTFPKYLQPDREMWAHRPRSTGQGSSHSLLPLRVMSFSSCSPRMWPNIYFLFLNAGYSASCPLGCCRTPSDLQVRSTRRSGPPLPWWHQKWWVKTLVWTGALGELPMPWLFFMRNDNFPETQFTGYKNRRKGKWGEEHIPL